MPTPLVVVTLDRMPAWILPAYGATWVSMPAVTGLAARGITCDGLVATGDDPREAARGMLGWLRDASRRVLVVTDDAAFADVVGCDRDLVQVPVVRPLRPTSVEDATNLGRLFAAAAAAVTAPRHDVVWCHASSLGLSWDAPPAFREAYLDPDDPPPPAGAAVPDLSVDAATDPDLVTGLRHVFAGQLTLLDRCLGRLVAAAGDHTAMLVAGLRGMPLGLHGRLGPGPLPPYAELVRLPAILIDRVGRMAGQRFDGLVVPADIGATVADLTAAGGDAPHGDALPLAPVGGDPRSGRSMAGLFTAWNAAGRDRVIVTAADGVAVVTNAWHLLRMVPRVVPAGDSSSTATALFVKPDDCFDLCDVADRCPAVAESLRLLAEAAVCGDWVTAWQGPLGAAEQGAG